MKNLLLLIVFVLSTSIISQTRYNSVNSEIEKGEFAKASKMIDELIAGGNLSASEIYDLRFQKEVLERIRKDFSKSEADMISFIKKYYLSVNAEDLKKWEDDGTLEHKIIDGRKFYFNRAQGNLFRVNKEAKIKKQQVDGNTKDELDAFLEKYLPEVVNESKSTGRSLVKPVEMKLKYKLVVEPDVVPAGEIIRCWLPYPKENHPRQHSLKLQSVNTADYIIAPDEYFQRTLYLEKPAVKGLPTEFSYELSLTAENEYHKVEESGVKAYDTSSSIYKEFTLERPPHIVFTDRIKKLSAEILDGESNPFIAAKKIYEWINNNIPWAGAREYSTIENISDYCLKNGWGDCGIKTLTFMTLCRYNGIPVKWQSGWMLHPGSSNLHDWCEIYFEGYGWLPVDQSFGLVDSPDEDVRWFYFGSTDAFHFIVNDDYSRELFPAKIYPRSETVDFQRGEVEWKGGNLYFDTWDYFMDIEYVNEKFE